MNFAVIGGINLDVTGTILGETRPGDSNPGKITLSPGGVGRNIASALREHGHEVLLVTALPLLALLAALAVLLPRRKR